MAPLNSIWQDLRISIRILRKSPGATALSVLSIALGVGLTAGMFSVGDAMLLRPMPFHQPGQLFAVTSLGDDGNTFLYGWLDYLDMTAAGSDVGELAAYQRRGLVLTAGDETENLLASPVTPNYFSLLGIKAMLGRASVDASSGRPRAVLGYRLWQRRFGGDPNLAGRTILLNGEAFLVAGVMPEEFRGLSRGLATDVWVSADSWFTVLHNRRERTGRRGQFEMVARLKPGITPQRAAAQWEAAIRGPGKHKLAPAGATGTVLTAGFGSNWAANLKVGGGLLLALALVLFVACANVAQLRLAQAESRKKELGVRLALGAGAWRVVRQLLVETGVVSLLGAGSGILFAQFLMEKAAQFLSAGSSNVDYGIHLDYRVLAFTLLAGLLAVLLAGLAPARHAVNVNICTVLKSEQGATGERRGWQKKLLVVGQVAVSVALLGTAAMFLDSLRNAVAVHPGMDPRKSLLVMTVGRGLAMDAAAWSEQACERLAGVSGVRGATYARRLPLSGSGGGLTARVEVPGASPLGVPLNNVGGNYFAIMGTRVVAGRGVDIHDRAGSGLVVVVSQAFAGQVFPGRNPIGEWLRIDGAMRKVVGVAEDGPSNDLHETPRPFIWLPYSQAPSDDITLMVETAGEPEALAKAIRAELQRFDPRADVYTSQTLKRQMDEALSQDRALASTAAGLGIFGVILTAAGLFGLLQFAVSRRTREFGLRMALGAPPVEIQRMVLGESIQIAAWGVPGGLVLLALAGWTLRSWLLGVTPIHPSAYVLSAIAGFALTLLAAWLPALRATRVDPMAALRSD
jgi:predicted permease